MTDYSPIPLGEDEEELQEFSFHRGEEIDDTSTALHDTNLKGDRSASHKSEDTGEPESPSGRRRSFRKTTTASLSPPGSPSLKLRSSSEDVQGDELELDPEEEILLRWKIEKWRWWPSKMVQQYAFYPWKHSFRILLGHGGLVLLLPMILFIVLLSYAVTIHHEIVRIAVSCILLY